MEAIKLTKPELKDTLKLFEGKKGQIPRLIIYLSNNPNSPTVFINTDCAIGNISDVARAANQELYKIGLFITCKRPKDHMKNKFGEPSRMFTWGICRVKTSSTGHQYTTDGLLKNG